ncbi:MAG: D-alanyl-D-alanine carboxypeptidase, partial [Mycobacterium sp.]|nr:D-alanyl-D-alanine carboxypeptidase [Mycobacterium sp.]
MLLAAAVIALVAMVVAAAALLTSGGRSNASVPAPRPPAASKPALIPVSDSAGMPSTAGMTAALAAAAANPNLGNLTGRISDAVTGTQIWEQRSGTPMQPASTNKILTAAAALLTLD